MLLRPLGLWLTAYSTEGDAAREAYYAKHFAVGVRSTANAGSNTDDFNWELVTSGSASAYPTTRVRPHEAYGLYSTSREYLAILNVLRNGGGMNGFRFLRAPTTRLLTKYVMSHSFNEVEAIYSGWAVTSGPMFWTLGGSASPAYVEYDLKHPMYDHV